MVGFCFVFIIGFESDQLPPRTKMLPHSRYGWQYSASLQLCFLDSRSLRSGLAMENLHLFPEFQKTLVPLIVLGYGNIENNLDPGGKKVRETSVTCHWPLAFATERIGP